MRRDRSLPHLSRKIYHCMMGLLCFSLYAFFLSRAQAIFTVCLIGGSFVLLDAGRFVVPQWKGMAVTLFGSLMRKEELHRLTANSYFVLGVLLTLLFFPKPIVLMSILFLAVGDPIAAIFGSLHGRTYLVGRKSLEGSLANFMACSLVSLLVGVFYFGISADLAPLFALTCGLIAAVAELLPSNFDDNLMIPTTSATLLTVVNHFASFF